MLIFKHKNQTNKSSLIKRLVLSDWPNFIVSSIIVRLPNRSIRYAENHRVVDSLRRLGTDPIEKLELLSATYTYSRAILTHLRSCLTTSLLHP